MLSSLLPDTSIFKKSFITCPPKRLGRVEAGANVHLHRDSATCIHASQSACHRTRELVAGLPALHGRVYQNESNNR